MYISQRKRREYLTVILLVQLTYEGSIDTDSDTMGNVRTIIDEALTETESSDMKQRAADYRAAFRLAYKTMGDWAKSHKGDIAGEKVVLTTYCFLELLNERGILAFTEESPLAAIMDWMLSHIDADNEITKKRLVTSRKQAIIFLEKLQKEGYFL